MANVQSVSHTVAQDLKKRRLRAPDDRVERSLNQLPIKIISHISNLMNPAMLANLAAVNHFYCVVAFEGAVNLQNTINQEFVQLYPADAQEKAKEKFLCLSPQIKVEALPADQVYKSIAGYFAQTTVDVKTAWFEANQNEFKLSYRYLHKYEILMHRVAGDLLDCLYDEIDIDKPYLVVLKTSKNRALETYEKIKDAVVGRNWEELISLSEGLITEGRLEEGILTFLSIEDDRVQKQNLCKILDDAVYLNHLEEDEKPIDKDIDRIVGIMKLVPDENWYFEIKEFFLNHFLSDGEYKLAEAFIESFPQAERKEYSYLLSLFYYQKEDVVNAMRVAQIFPPDRLLLEIRAGFFQTERQLVASIEQLLQAPSGAGGIRAQAESYAMTILDHEVRQDMVDKIQKAWPLEDNADDNLSD